MPRRKERWEIWTLTKSKTANLPSSCVVLGVADPYHYYLQLDGLED